jgi:hypothetical protein
LKMEAGVDAVPFSLLRTAANDTSWDECGVSVDVLSNTFNGIAMQPFWTRMSFVAIANVFMTAPFGKEG